MHWEIVQMCRVVVVWSNLILHVIHYYVRQNIYSFDSAKVGLWFRGQYSTCIHNKIVVDNFLRWIRATGPQTTLEIFRAGDKLLGENWIREPPFYFMLIHCSPT